MGRTVDYYFAPQSPWVYLGHQRFADMVRRAGATVRVMPIDLGGKVFPISGGLPLGPERKEIRRVADRSDVWRHGCCCDVDACRDAPRLPV